LYDIYHTGRQNNYSLNPKIMYRNIILSVILLAVMQSVSAQFQKPTIDAAVASKRKLNITPKRSEITQVKLLQEINNPPETDGQANILPGIRPNQEFEKIDAEILRKTEEKIRNLKSYYPDEEPNKSPLATAPAINNDFHGNVYDGWRPPDNNLAISNAGDIVTCTNSHIYYYNSSGMLIYSASYETFFGNTNYILYDPKILFDPVSNRFIMVVLQGNTPAFTRVLLCYSKSNDPTDGWWVYSLNGDVGGNGNWFDYPNLAISTNEVFITGNLFNASDNFQTAVIYQVDKVNGYNGNTINFLTWSNLYSAPFTLVPVSYGQSGNYGPGIYLVSTDENGTGTDQLRLYEISNDLSNSPTCNAYSVAGSFASVGNAPQSGTTTLLDNGGNRIRNGFYLNGIVHFVLSDQYGATGYNGIQYNRLTVSGLSNSSHSFGLDGYDYSYPSVASYGTSSTDKTVIIAFLRSSSTIFPEFRVVECDDAGAWSGSVQVKAGETYIHVNPTGGVERWGDYTGIVRKDNTTPEIWVAGCFGEAVTAGGHKYGTWLAQITDCTRPAKPVVISGNTPACRSQVNTYSISAVSGATSYTWTLPSGWTGSSTTNSINVTPGTVGGTIYVYAHNACGVGMAQSLAVTSVATPIITSVTPDSRCGGGILTLGATASAGTINWYDFVSGGISLGTGTSFNTPINFFSNIYYVDATSNGCTTDARTAVTATVYAIPSISGTTPASRCGTGTVTLGATASAGTINWYATSFGGASLGTGISFITPSISTTTTYYVDATANGCTTAARTAVTATVNAIPTISGTTPGSRCGTGTVTLGATASAGTVNWYAASSGGTPLATGTSFITPTITATTPYYVNATANGCTTAARTAVTATVNNVPAQPDLISGPSPVCEGSTNTYTIAAVPGATYYTWTLPAGWSGSSVTSSIDVVAGTAAGSVSVTANNACGAGTARSKGIALVNVPVMLVLQNYNVVSGQNLCFNTSQTISLAGSGSIFYVQPGGSAILTAGQQINYFPGAWVREGGYMHGYIASGVCCGITPPVPAIHTNESGNENSETASLPSTGNSYFKVYPNPTSGNFILEMSGDLGSGKVHVDIFGIRGDIIATEIISGERKHEFSLSNRPPGIYYLRVISGNRATTAKIIKQ
jgi:hypothetical protein